MEKNKKILIVDDETTICEILSASLEDEGFEVKAVHSGADAIKILSEYKPAVMLLDIWMPGELDGIDVLEKIKNEMGSPKVIVMSGHGTIETAVKAVKLGAWDFIEKPISMEKVLITINNILLFSQQENEKRSLLNQLRESFFIAGDSDYMQKIKSLVMKFGFSSSNYLLKGDEGVGKELIARNIHYVSKRAGMPFVSINCNTLPKSLQIIELWGDDQNKPGVFNIAQGGSVLIKNIENLSMESQEKLVELLRDKESAKRYNIRIVATTSLDLMENVKEGKFREDLYRKISALTLELKPLKEHKEDIPVLVEYFSEEYCRQAGTGLRGFTNEAIAQLQKHNWPGNVLELKNFVERLHILSTGEKFDVYDINYAGITPSGSVDFNGYGNFREARAQFEKEYLLAKISENEGNISKTSEAIGLERSYLHRKIKAYGIDVEKS